MNYELRHEQIFLFNSALVWRCALFIFHVCMKLDTQMLNINKITIKSLIHSVCTLFALNKIVNYLLSWHHAVTESCHLGVLCMLQTRESDASREASAS